MVSQMATVHIDNYFAFAIIKGEFMLVQVSTPVTALSTVDVKVFRHEFINIFRFSDDRTLHPVDINIIEPINDDLIRYEEENETVFLARDIMEHMRKLTNPRRNTVGMGRTWSSVKKQQHADSTRTPAVKSSA